jgi:signal transduction histidine kinase/CheY-like chemotaxis protein
MADVYAEHDRVLFQASGTQAYETTIRDPEGKNHDVVFHKATFRTPDGQIGGLIGAIFDITDRKRAENALRAIVEATSAATGATFFRNLVRQLGLALDMSCVIVAEIADVSRTHARTLAVWSGNVFAENFQYKLKGTPCGDVVEAGLRWYAQDLQRRFPDDHQLVEMAAECYVGVPLKDSSGNVLGLMAVLDTKPLEHEGLVISMLQIFSTRAATELARQRAELEQMRLESELRHAQKMEAIGTLATGIAHDFNNLLTAISGYTELAKSHLEPNHPSRDALEIVGTAVRDGGGIADSLLTFGHKTPAVRVAVDLCKAVKDSMRLLSMMLPSSILVCERYLVEDSLHVHADVGHLHHLLMNLMTNARDAMPEGGVIQVTISRESEEEAAAAGLVGGSSAALLVIEDTGAGMAQETLAQMFNPFFTTKPRGKGTGLGLAMVHGIIREHHGRIDVQSEPGKGTRIEVRLPCCSPPECSGVPDAPHVERTASERRILLAEDNDLVRAITAQTLKARGYTVTDVSSGTAAVDQLQRSPADVDLLILDIDLPGKTGLQCLAEIRRTQPTLPALLITGNAVVSENDGMDDNTILLRKPFRMSELCFLVPDQV